VRPSSFFVGFNIYENLNNKRSSNCKTFKNSVGCKIDLSEKTDKKLVPFGYANHDDETNEIELKYRIYVEGGIRKSIMHTNLLSVTVDDGTDFSHLFLVIFPKEQEINKLH
jgi:hypothetical protein